MICPNCGYDNEEGNFFCVKCGTRLLEAAAPIAEPVATDAPTDAPADVQATEVPDAEVPNMDAPGMETPDMEPPIMDAPNMEAPNMEVPSMEIPGTEVPDMDTASTDAPSMETPNVETPYSEGPYVQPMNNEAPAMEMPGAGVQGAEIYGQGMQGYNSSMNYGAMDSGIMNNGPMNNDPMNNGPVNNTWMNDTPYGNGAIGNDPMMGNSFGQSGQMEDPTFNMPVNPPSTAMEAMMNGKGQKKNTGLIAGIVVVALIAAAGIGFYVYSGLPSTKYGKGEAAFKEGNYEQAVEYFEAAGDYEDAPEKMKEAEVCIHYEEAQKAMAESDYDTALKELEQTGNYSDSKELARECHYEKGMKYKKSGDYMAAKEEFVKADGYKDSTDQIIAMGEELTQNGEYADAAEIFSGVEDAERNQYKAYAEGMVCYEAKDYDDASTYFKAAGDTLDADEKYKECKYEAGTQMFAARQYDSARGLFASAGDYKDSENMANACSMMKAKEKMDEGYLNAALEALKALPEDTAYNDISVSGLISKLESNQKWLDICGVWTSTKGQMRSTESTSTYDSWWYHDFGDGDVSIDVQCRLNDDGTCNVTVTGFINVFTNYAENKEDIKKKLVTIMHTETMKDLGKISIDDNTSVTLKKGTVTANYKASERKNGRSYTYKTDITFGNRLLDY